MSNSEIVQDSERPPTVDVLNEQDAYPQIEDETMRRLEIARNQEFQDRWRERPVKMHSINRILGKPRPLPSEHSRPFPRHLEHDDIVSRRMIGVSEAKEMAGHIIVSRSATGPKRVRRSRYGGEQSWLMASPYP